MTDKLVKVTGYAFMIGTQSIILTKDEAWKLFHDMIDILNIPVNAELAAPEELQ